MQRPRRENETIENSAYRNTFVVTHKHRRFRIISPFQPPFLQHIYPSFLLFSFCHGEHGSGSVKISRCFLFNNETPASTRLAEARVARKLTASHGVVSKCMVAFQSINWPALVRISIPVRTREAHRQNIFRFEETRTRKSMMLLEHGLYNFYCERNGKFKYYIREIIILKDIGIYRFG